VSALFVARKYYISAYRRGAFFGRCFSVWREGETDWLYVCSAEKRLPASYGRLPAPKQPRVLKGTRTALYAM
jgi:hypothetical protein